MHGLGRQLQVNKHPPQLALQATMATVACSSEAEVRAVLLDRNCTKATALDAPAASTSPQPQPYQHRRLHGKRLAVFHESRL